jgi:hypothetical protein
LLTPGTFSAAMIAARRALSLLTLPLRLTTPWNIDIHRARPPGRIRHGGNDKLADPIVGLRKVFLRKVLVATREVRDGGQEIPAGDHADKAVAAHHRKALHIVCLHDLNNFCKRASTTGKPLT